VELLLSRKQNYAVLRDYAMIKDICIRDWTKDRWSRMPEQQRG
jgi:hypothetical protein